MLFALLNRYSILRNRANKHPLRLENIQLSQHNLIIQAMATSKQQQLTRGWSLLGTVMPGFYNQRERPLESKQPFLTY